MKTVFQPAFELEDAKRLAKELDVPMTIIETDILAVEKARENGPDRCYHCKKALFLALREQAERDGFPVLLDGTNASDDANDRPGMQALRELNIRSPLQECGISKEEVRRMSREAGLFTWNKPAYACLATRIPTGTAIRRSDLERTEAAESRLAALGFTDFRVRISGENARLQVTEDQTALVLEKRADILEALKPYFTGVLLDMEPRQKSR